MSLYDRDERIAALRKGGMGPRDIARHLGVTPNVVAGVLFRAGLTDPIPGATCRVVDLSEEMRRERVPVVVEEPRVRPYGKDLAAQYLGVTPRAFRHRLSDE